MYSGVSFSFLNARSVCAKGEDISDRAVCELIVAVHHKFGPVFDRSVGVSYEI